MEFDPTKDAVLTKQQAAEFLQMSVRTLSRLQAEGKGPPYSKVRGRVLYLKSALISWFLATQETPVRS